MSIQPTSTVFLSEMYEAQGYKMLVVSSVQIILARWLEIWDSEVVPFILSAPKDISYTILPFIVEVHCALGTLGR